MTGFVYTVYLPGIKQTVSLTELNFSDYKHLVKTLTNNNDEHINSAFNDIINKCCLQDVSMCTALDKTLILLTIRNVCISPILDLVVTCSETQKQFNCNAEFSSLIEKIQNFNINVSKEITYGKDISVLFNIPKDLYISTDINALQSVINTVTIGEHSTQDTNLLVEKLPAVVLKDAKSYISDISEKLNEFELINITSPYSDNASQVQITANFFNGSVIEFLKICFKKNLMSIYELEYFLFKHNRISYDLMCNSTPAELAIYTSLYKEEQKEREKAEKGNESIPLNSP